VDRKQTIKGMEEISSLIFCAIKEGRPTPETPYDLERTDIKVGYLIE
jgi:hypothetical protein